MDSTNKLFLLIAVIVASVLLPVSSSVAATPVKSAQVRVIVTLALPAQAPGSDTGAAISQATDSLLAQLPANDYTVTNRYAVMPFVGLLAGPTTRSVLSVLQSNGLVVAVERDKTVTTASASKCKTAKATKRGKKAKTAKKCKRAAQVH
jgi:hypothetical protein